MNWRNACTTEEDLGSGRQRVVIGLKPRAWERPTAGGGTVLTEIPPAFTDTGDAALPRGRSGLLTTRMADRLAGQSPQVHVGRGKYHIRMSAIGTNNVPGAAVLDGTGKEIGRRYNGAWTGADLEAVDIGHRVLKHIYLHTGHPQQYEVRIDDRAGNLVASPRGWDLLDDSGSPVLYATPGFLFKPDDPMAGIVPVQTTVRVQGGKSIYRYVLPPGNWAGWVLDPTWTSQPGAAEGIDTFLDSAGPNTNTGTNVNFYLGEHKSAVDVSRGCIYFDTSAVPSTATLQLVELALTLIQDGTVLASNDRTLRAYRLERAWVESQATWNIYSTGNNWATAGGFGAADCEQTSIGSGDFATTDLSGAVKTITFTPTSLSALDLGNGWLLKMDTENADMYNTASSDHATAAWWPKLTVEYQETARSAFAGRGRVPILSRGRW